MTIGAILALGGTASVITGLALVIALRPDLDTAVVAPGHYAVWAWGTPEYLLKPVRAALWLSTGLFLLIALRPAYDAAGRLWIGFAVIFVLVAGIGWVLLETAIETRVIAALRRRLRPRYPDRLLLVADRHGIAATGWGPLAWHEVAAVRLERVSAGKVSWWVLAVDTVASPRRDEPRARWSHRYFYGNALVVDLRQQIAPMNDVLAELRALQTSLDAKP